MLTLNKINATFKKIGTKLDNETVIKIADKAQLNSVMYRFLKSDVEQLKKLYLKANFESQKLATIPSFENAERLTQNGFAEMNVKRLFSTIERLNPIFVEWDTLRNRIAQDLNSSEYQNLVAKSNEISGLENQKFYSELSAEEFLRNHNFELVLKIFPEDMASVETFLANFPIIQERTVLKERLPDAREKQLIIFERVIVCQMKWQAQLNGIAEGKKVKFDVLVKEANELAETCSDYCLETAEKHIKENIIPLILKAKNERVIEKITLSNPQSEGFKSEHIDICDKIPEDVECPSFDEWDDPEAQ